MSLTYYKVREESNLSAHTACDESSITHSLEDEGGVKFVSPHSMWWIWCHLQAERWRSREQFVSPHCMWWIKCHLLPGRWRGMAIHQPMPHAMVLPHLTPVNPFPWSISKIPSWFIRAAISTAFRFVSLPTRVSRDQFTRLHKHHIHAQSAASAVFLTSASTILVLPRSIAMWSGAPNSDPTFHSILLPSSINSLTFVLLNIRVLKEKVYYILVSIRTRGAQRSSIIPS